MPMLAAVLKMALRANCVSLVSMAITFLCGSRMVARQGARVGSIGDMLSRFHAVIPKHNNAYYCAFIGVRISWLMVARNVLLARLALSA